MAENEFLEPFERMLAKLFDPGEVRAIERGGQWQDKWQEVEESGFLDALVPEEMGGVGLTLDQAGPLLIAIGKYAVPLPIGETIVARSLLAQAGQEVPEGAIALSTGLLPVPNIVDAPHQYGPEGETLQLYAALLRAACMAGAAQRVLDMSVAYVNERVQFGKPIGRQQAIQQQLAVMAEQVVAMRMAVELGCATADAPSLQTVATAKAVTSKFAPLVANCGHAVHGAIGISEEYDLQLYTRRLFAWSRADGGADYWNAKIGEAVIQSGLDSIDWIRGTLF
jgi:alkylation response protein AidB-like acyl-CoA dehydrogenase